MKQLFFLWSLHVNAILQPVIPSPTTRKSTRHDSLFLSNGLIQLQSHSALSVLQQQGAFVGSKPADIDSDMMWRLLGQSYAD